MDAVRFTSGEIEVSEANGLKEVLGFAFDTIGCLLAACKTLECGSAVEIEKESHVRQAGADSESVNLRGDLRRDLSGNALIDGRRVEKSVGDHDAAMSEGGADDFPHKLGAAGGEKEKFCLRNEGHPLGSMLEQMANCLARRRPARFPHKKRIVAESTQGVGQQADLRRFSAALGPFKSEKNSFSRGACFHRDTSHTALGIPSMQSRKISFIATKSQEKAVAHEAGRGQGPDRPSPRDRME